MRRATHWRAASGLLLTSLLVASPARAEQGEPGSDEAARATARQDARRADTAEALALLEGMFDYLNALTRFAFVAHIGYDAVQTTGQKLEFGGRRRLLVRRPDRMRVEARNREGELTELFFDGERISVSLPSENAYASVEKTGTLEEAIDYLEQDLSEPVPLLDLVHTGLYGQVAERVRYGLHVGEETVAERRCDHLAFQGDELDFQIWIEQGERPLPVRLVITYKQRDGSPQFWAQWTHWDLVPDARDELFEYAPPEGAERLPFAPPVRGSRASGGG